MELMCNLHTLYFLLTAYAAVAFVCWLINDLHKYILTYMLSSMLSRKTCLNNV